MPLCGVCAGAVCWLLYTALTAAALVASDVSRPVRGED
jgi:hypothetical protein